MKKIEILILFVLFSFDCMGEEMINNNKITFDSEKLKSQIQLLEFKKLNYSTEMENYFKCYNLNFKAIDKYFGYINYENYNLATTVYLSQEKKITVLIVHGYLVHSGYLSQFVKMLLENGYNVITFDLPGHGLSSGETAGINDFKDYGKIVSAVLNKYSANFPDDTIYAVGHSTGCSALYEYMNFENEVKIEHYFFLAPLIRLNHWQLSLFGNKLFKIFKCYPRIFRNSSSNREYLYFQKNIDPIQIRKLPKSWYNSLVKWNKINISYPIADEKVTLIQGKKDNIVDYKYNIEFLKKKIKHLDVELLKDGKHDLINEQESIMNKVYQTILEEIDKEREINQD